MSTSEVPGKTPPVEARIADLNVVIWMVPSSVAPDSLPSKMMRS